MDTDRPGGRRSEVERRSAAPLVLLSQQPRWLLGVLAAALLAAVVFAPAVFAVPSLVVLLLVLGWLSYLSWPITPPPARVARAVALGVLLLAAVRNLSG